MPDYYQTAIGGVNNAFLTTRWTQVIQAGADDDTVSRATVAALTQRYWKPVYACLRRKGYDNETAKDLTQGFFTDVVFGRDLLPQADRAKGRFRTFLLTALDRYATDVRRHERARKRRPADGLAPLDVIDGAHVPEPAHAHTPEAAFHYAWAANLVRAALDELEAECRRDGKETHWEVFRARVVGPIFDGTPAAPLEEVCARLGIGEEQKASNMLVTVKRRFGMILRKQVSQSVGSEEQVEEELGELMKILAGAASGGR